MSPPLRASNEGLLGPALREHRGLTGPSQPLLPNRRVQGGSRLHGVGNQAICLSFLNQLLGFGCIGARRERDGRLQHDGRELKLPIDQFQLPFGRTLVRGKGQACSLRHCQERRHHTDIGGRDE